MQDSTRKNIIFLVTALIAVLAGMAVGVGLITLWPRLARPPAPPAGPTTCTLDQESSNVLSGIRLAAEASQEEIDTLRVVIAELIDKMESRPAPVAGGGGGIDGLPNAYIRQVNDFFKTATAKNLLSSKVSADSVKFGEPSFITYDVIAIPYIHSGKTSQLLVKIKILDYSDLQFDVMWDSLEAR